MSEDITVQQQISTSENSVEEAILCDDLNRFTLFPIKYPAVYEMYKKAESAIWHAADINFLSDREDWRKLGTDQQHFIKYVLAFFAGSDGIVNENLVKRFSTDIKIPEARAFYAVQIFVENVHAETYSLLIDTYITDIAEKSQLFEAIKHIPCISKKAAWAIKWMECEASFAQRLIGFAAVEGIFFSGSFCAIYWLNEQGLLRALCESNDYIARDEGMHTDFACLLYKNYIRNKLPRQLAHEIIGEAVEIECEFITEALPCNLIGMNARTMKDHIKFVADRLLVQLGYEKLYNTGTKSPFDFMDRIALSNKTNFFEGNPTEYKRNVIATENVDPYSGIEHL